MARLRFVHAADLHLDSPFRGIRNEAPEHVADTLRRATFEAYDNIIDLCLREQVDALLVAGDIYDGADRSLRAQLKFVDGLRRLDAAGIRSFVCHGNHDPLNGWEARLDLPPGCVRFGPQVTGEPVFADEPQRAMVYGISYPQRVVTENLSVYFREPISSGPGTSTGSNPSSGLVSSGFVVGLLHANVGGNTAHDNYSPCSVSDLADAGVDYWALGHVHTRQVLREERPAVVYPGNPQGRHPAETGPRGVYLVEVDDHGGIGLEFRPVDMVRWEALQIGITDMETEQELLDSVDRAVEDCAESADGRPVVYRLSLTGRGKLNSWLRQGETAAEIRERLNERFANSRQWLWCERAQADTASAVDRQEAALREDFAGDLARLAGEMKEDPEALAELRGSLRTLYSNSNASSFLRDHLPSDNELRELLAAAEEECLAALVGDEEDI